VDERAIGTFIGRFIALSLPLLVLIVTGGVLLLVPAWGGGARGVGVPVGIMVSVWLALAVAALRVGATPGVLGMLVVCWPG